MIYLAAVSYPSCTYYFQIQGTDLLNSAANAPKSYADKRKVVSGCAKGIDVEKCYFLVWLSIHQHM